VEYQIRAARITDVERLVALWSESAPAVVTARASAAADLLRQLVYIPHASVLVAETLRTPAGFAVLTLRPSISVGGYVGTVDILAVDPHYDEERVTERLLEEVLRSARNKGCTVVEAMLPAEGEVPAAWENFGFAPSGPRMECPVRAERAAVP
jgi:N-acetylglutamate synthase-like GNAT family acetyltransferase